MFGRGPGTRPNISESHSEIITRVPFCIATSQMMRARSVELDKMIASRSYKPTSSSSIGVKLERAVRTCAQPPPHSLRTGAFPPPHSRGQQLAPCAELASIKCMRRMRCCAVRCRQALVAYPILPSFSSTCVRGFEKKWCHGTRVMDAACVKRNCTLPPMSMRISLPCRR